MTRAGPARRRISHYLVRATPVRPPPRGGRPRLPSRPVASRRWQAPMSAMRSQAGRWVTGWPCYRRGGQARSRVNRAWASSGWAAIMSLTSASSGCPRARPDIRAACGTAVPSPGDTVSADVTGAGARCVGQSSARRWISPAWWSGLLDREPRLFAHWTRARSLGAAANS
jgi:hypothetical protein